VRDCVQLERVVALLVNLTVGQIRKSSVAVNPLEKNRLRQDGNYDKIRMLILLVVSVGQTAVTFARSYNEPIYHSSMQGHLC
jgi:hypothetical protein